jgi:anti-sigma regulatory factor (Ser/Thr protein kinase)
MPLTHSSTSLDSNIVFRIPARLADVRLLGISVHSLFANLGFSDIDVYQLELAVTEAANNIVKHAGLAKDKAQISMKFSVMSDKLVCTFIDQGKPVDFLLKDSTTGTIQNVGNLPVSKRGLLIVCDVMDKVSYTRTNGKNVLTLVKYFTR